MNTKIFFVAGLIVLSVMAVFLWFRTSDRFEQQVLGSTYDVSKEYLSLRYRTDMLLVNAEEYGDYTTWDDAMTAL
ncbi:MAG TPA: hypothetical protein PKJ68_02325, partial [Candidatus Woesebacteria bacterium]|nr:hypothetical protein [Candidatus Woesebacteria bacterium]